MIRFLLSVHSVKFRFGSGPIWFLSINQVPIEICSENNRFSCSAKICIMHIKRINFELIKNKFLNHDWSLINMSDNYPQLKLIYSPSFTELRTNVFAVRSIEQYFFQNNEQRTGETVRIMRIPNNANCSNCENSSYCVYVMFVMISARVCA